MDRAGARRVHRSLAASRAGRGRRPGDDARLSPSHNSPTTPLPPSGPPSPSLVPPSLCQTRNTSPLLMCFRHPVGARAYRSGRRRRRLRRRVRGVAAYMKNKIFIILPASPRLVYSLSGSKFVHFSVHIRHSSPKPSSNGIYLQHWFLFCADSLCRHLRSARGSLSL